MARMFAIPEKWQSGSGGSDAGMEYFKQVVMLKFWYRQIREFRADSNASLLVLQRLESSGISVTFLDS